MKEKNEKLDLPAVAGGVESPAKPVKVEHMSGAEVKQAEQVKSLGLSIIKAVGQVAGRYLALVTYIRKNSVAPKLVSFELTRLGFKRSRVSEINRVAQSSEALFANYQAKMIGFDKCLAMARSEKDGAPATATPAALLLERNGAVSADEVDKMIEAETSIPAEGGGVRKAVKPLVGTKKKEALRAAARVLARFSTGPRSYIFPDCRYKIVVEGLPKTGPAVGDDEG